MIRQLKLVLVMMTLAWTSAAIAQTPVTMRAETLLAALKTANADAASFAPNFLAQVPIAQVDAIAAQLKAQNGAVIGIASLKSRDATEADVVIEYERATVSAQFAIEPDAPHRFIGLLITGVAKKDDSFAKIVGELKALPGTTALLIRPLGSAAPIVAHNEAAPLAIASSFKLFVLAALSREVFDGRRKWSDVVPLGPPSLPSGVTQDWPRGTPMTLQALATQMISISDNTATDTLMNVIGRAKIDAARGGATANALPVLTTLEAFSLKMPDRAALRARWVAGSLADRRRVIDELKPTVAALDRRALGSGPLHIDTVEWPATMRELGGALLGFVPAERDLDPLTLPERAILSVNTALAPDLRARFAYVGYKGGSETGVIAMNWLLQTRSGDWFAVTGAWNNPAAAVDEKAFVALMVRAVALVTPPKVSAP